MIIFLWSLISTFVPDWMCENNQCARKNTWSWQHFEKITLLLFRWLPIVKSFYILACSLRRVHTGQRGKGARAEHRHPALECLPFLLLIRAKLKETTWICFVCERTLRINFWVCKNWKMFRKIYSFWCLFYNESVTESKLNWNLRRRKFTRNI